jgi:hypothetical protein
VLVDADDIFEVEFHQWVQVQGVRVCIVSSGLLRKGGRYVGQQRQQQQQQLMKQAPKNFFGI